MSSLVLFSSTVTTEEGDERESAIKMALFVNKMKD